MLGGCRAALGRTKGEKEGLGDVWGGVGLEREGITFTELLLYARHRGSLGAHSVCYLLRSLP